MLFFMIQNKTDVDDNICAFIFDFPIFMTSINVTRPLFFSFNKTVTFHSKFNIAVDCLCYDVSLSCMII